MKSILIAINVMLAILAAGEVIKCLSEKEDTMPARVTTKEKSAKESTRTTIKAATPSTDTIQRSPAQMDEQVNVIAALNIFSPDRTPEIPTIAMRMAANNTRAEMKLVGTFEIDGTKGAIILQRTNQRNGNRNNFGFDGGFGFGGFGFGGMGFGMDQNTANQNNNTAQASAEEVSQAQIEDARQRLTQLQSVLQTLQRNGASADQLASITRQIEAQNTLLQQLLAISSSQDASEDGVASISATNTNNVRQYLRLGDSTADGYMLIDVTRTTATLRRNNDVIELTIQKASENQEAMALAASRANSAQVIVADPTPATSSSPAPSNNNRGRRNNGGFGGDFGGFGGGDFGGGDFGNFGGGEGGFGGFGGDFGGFGGFGGGNNGFGGGNNGFGGGNGGFGGRNNNSRTNTMNGGNRNGMNSNSRTTTNSASSRNTNTTNRTGMNNNNSARTNTAATRNNTNSATRNNTNMGSRTNNNARSNTAGRTGVNTGNRTGGGIGGR